MNDETLNDLHDVLAMVKKDEEREKQPVVKLIPISPSGHETIIMLDGIERIPVWTPTPIGDTLRTTRVKFGLSMGACGRALGLSVTDYSGLENGRVTLSAGDWCKVWMVLHAEMSKESGK